MASFFLCLSLLFISLSTADGFKMYVVSRCDFNSTELKDIKYIRAYYYNKIEYARFDSDVGKFVGYTDFGVKQAKYFNSHPGRLAAARAEKERYCHNNIGVWYKNILTKSVKPYVKLHSTTPAYSQHPAMLVCSVYDFFPSKIKVSWLRDGQEVTSDVTSTEEMADGDWYYQTHSHLEYTPRSGEKISCKVEHASLEKPLITDWDSSMPESERNKLAIGASGLILGLILSLAGFIYYRPVHT
ncbi:H-2 class II histocompatibility antigen, I-E beta chain-like isoform X2 [Simochromis diagramma]|uniref:H-2 class II histocompatibility antigen, I-E beta chain-like isoform X2 n=1 Tax=Simochromis diagramma TaxID=43689 RepID=UPI001A7E3A0C|nr:H-2 class II histocompatibility antigen, I-E beta chain-like isoform X2 [Simochromis diagramma]